MNQLSGTWSQVRLDREVHLSDKLEWGQQVGIIPRARQCRRDRVEYTLEQKSNYVLGYGWRCPKCHKRERIGIGTVFEDSHMDIGRVLMMAWSFANDSTYHETAIACSYDEETPHTKAIAHWFERFRGLTSDWAVDYQNSSFKIGGPGKIVQMDEAWMVTGQWVLGMIDQDGDLRLEICSANKRPQQALVPLIQKHVKLGSEIHTDEWRAYQVL